MSQPFFNDDMHLFLDHRVDWKRFFDLKHGNAAAAGDEVATYKSVLQTLGEICAGLAAESREHWHEEVRLVDGRVVVPPHIAAGYERLRQAGLICLPIGSEYGGYGLPILINTFYLEMIARANSSLMTIVGLQTGVASDIERYGSDELKRRYLPRFTSGELQGSMDLTEPGAGSDLGGITTRVSEENGRYFVDGEKIFITNGGAPIHLVLARDDVTYQRSKGTTMGLSLILCPAMLPDGTPNRLRVSRVEAKMGIHGSPTCAIELDHAEGFLLGRRGNGFRAMLDLMNNARLGVAAQALGVAEAAYRAAREHALQRVQFRRPIVEQPLVKSLLAQMTTQIQAARALLYRTSALIDITDALRAYLESERSAGDPNRAALEEEHKRNKALVRFLTPLCKYYCAEISNDVTRKGIQVHGGIGYMAESPAGHYHADSIITTIYEGTSEIQAGFALLEMSRGTFTAALDATRSEIAALGSAFPGPTGLIGEAIERWILPSLPALLADREYASLNAKRACDMIIDVVAAAELLQQAQVSGTKAVLAQSFIQRRMLAVEMNARHIASGDASRIRHYDQILGLPPAPA